MTHVMKKSDGRSATAHESVQEQQWTPPPPPRCLRRKHGGLTTTNEEEEERGDPAVESAASIKSQEVATPPDVFDGTRNRPKGWFRSPKTFFPTSDQQARAETLGEELYLNYFSPGV